MRGTTQIPDDVRQVLAGSQIVGNLLKLPGQLDRATYTKVDKVLKGLGGKWDRKAGGHMFQSSPAELVGQGVENGAYVDRKKALQYFPTPAAVVARMVDRAQIDLADSILEPEAGQGAIIEGLSVFFLGNVTAVEIDAENCAVLRKKFATVNVVETDFLEYAKGTDDRFNVILMNPPFASNQDIAHIRAAYSLLRDGGRLVAICGEGAFFRSDRIATGFRDWLDTIGVGYCVLPAGTFRESGTEVATRMIWVRK